jgi:hypothetical protein
VPSMEHPRKARFMAIARPIPREAPVTTATLPMRGCSRICRVVIVKEALVLPFLEVKDQKGMIVCRAATLNLIPVL